MNHYPERTSDFTKAAVGRLQLLSGYSGLYLSNAFRNLGMNLISLFIPLYILRITNNFVSIFLFYSLYHLAVVFFDYPAAVLIRYLGIDWGGFLGAISRAGFVFILLKAENQPFYLWWAAIVWGMAVALTWLSFHYTFTVAEKEDGKYGKEVSRLRIVDKITELVGPIAGGLIIASLDFKSLFSFAIVLIIVSGMPLFFDLIKGKGMRLSLEKITYHLARKRKSKFWLSFAGKELEGAVLGLVWPVFIYLVVRNYEALGLIKSAATLVSIVIVWFLGKWIDRKGKSILHLGTVINSFNVLLRPFLLNPFAIFLVDSAYGITSDLVVTPFDSAFYEEAIKMRKLEFMVEREFVTHLSGTIICLFLGLVFILKINWFWIFFLAMVGILMRNYILTSENSHT